MIISVLERRQEIGLRRALGATRGQIRVQFLSEAIVLGLLGVVAGVIAASQHLSIASSRTPRRYLVAKTECARSAETACLPGLLPPSNVIGQR
jgi:cell division protein FtsX